jgi:hypothetical protein
MTVCVVGQLLRLRQNSLPRRVYTAGRVIEPVAPCHLPAAKGVSWLASSDYG